MDCRAARDWLLQAEHPGAWTAASDGPAGHLEGCPACRALAVELERLESDYRDQPLPPGGDHAREAFIERMPLSLPRRRWFARSRRALAAAVVLLACLGGYLWWVGPTPPEQETSPDVVERLIDWNLALADASDEAGRQALDKEAPQLRSAVAEARLPDDDRELAESLLESGEFISVRTDPMDQADRFNDLADKLLAQIDSATTKRDANRLRKLANCYRRIAEQGVRANLDRLEGQPLNPKRAKKFQRILNREAARADKLQRLLERAPKASRKDLQRALAPAKPHRGKKSRKP